MLNISAHVVSWHMSLINVSNSKNVLTASAAKISLLDRSHITSCWRSEVLSYWFFCLSVRQWWRQIVDATNEERLKDEWGHWLAGVESGFIDRGDHGSEFHRAVDGENIMGNREHSPRKLENSLKQGERGEEKQRNIKMIWPLIEILRSWAL